MLSKAKQRDTAKGQEIETQQQQQQQRTLIPTQSLFIGSTEKRREAKRREEKSSHKTHRELKRAQLKFPKAMNFSDSAAIYEHAPEAVGQR